MNKVTLLMAWLMSFGIYGEDKILLDFKGTITQQKKIFLNDGKPLNVKEDAVTKGAVRIPVELIRNQSSFEPVVVVKGRVSYPKTHCDSSQTSGRGKRGSGDWFWQCKEQNLKISNWKFKDFSVKIDYSDALRLEGNHDLFGTESDKQIISFDIIADNILDPNFKIDPATVRIGGVLKAYHGHIVERNGKLLRIWANIFH